MHPVITLTTDFGLDDPFVGVMKGVILGIAPEARIIDLTHAIEPQNILSAAWTLKTAHAYFPANTVHVVVVDPGVGTSRRPLAAKCGRQMFVGPDNGVLSGVFDPSARFYELTRKKYFLETISSTFQGRDIFAPVAARLATGVRLPSVGARITDPVTLDLPRPRQRGRFLEGEIISIDRFGNIITNISPDHLASAFGGSPEKLEIRTGSCKIAGLSAHYAQSSGNRTGALINSWNLLEIFINQGNAARKWKRHVGDKVSVSLKGINS